MGEQVHETHYNPLGRRRTDERAELRVRGAVMHRRRRGRRLKATSMGLFITGRLFGWLAAQQARLFHLRRLRASAVLRLLLTQLGAYRRVDKKGVRQEKCAPWRLFPGSRWGWVLALGSRG